MLDDLQRRVLGHLPVWRTPDDAQAASENELAAVPGPFARSIVAYNLPELTARLALDASLPNQSEEDVLAVLEDLEAQGLAAQLPQPDALPNWQMTEAGRAALHAQPESVPPPHDLARIKSMVETSVRLVAAGMEPGSNEFNRGGGIDLDGFKAWRAAHVGPGGANYLAELDVLERQAPPIPPPAEEETPNA
jgi:hypothetical protein